MKPIVLLAVLLNAKIGFSQVCILQATTNSAITRTGENNFTLSGLRITSSNNCIRLSDCQNVTISNCVFGPSAEEAIKLTNCQNVTIVNCIFKDNGNGVYAYQSQGIKVLNNQFLNVKYFTSRGQFVQFNNVSGSGNEISNNVGENIWGNSSSEDLINIYQSNGTSTSPILIKGNKFRGGGPGASPTGGSCGGIMTGDDGGSYIQVEDNILVNPGQYGIAIAGGTNIKILNNKVYAQQLPINNIGMYVWNQYNVPCNTHLIQGNEIAYTNNNGILNPFWDAGNCTPVNYGANTFCFSQPCGLSSTILPERLLCPELSAYYKFSGNFYDATGSALTLTSTNVSIINGCGSDGSAANFVGTNSYLSIPRSTWLKPSSEKISLSCWIKPNNLQGIKAIARSQDGNGWDNGWRMLLLDGTLNIRLVTTAGPSEIYCDGLAANQWNHVAMTYDGKNLKGYINGVLKSTTPVSGNISYAATNYNMAIGFSNGDYYFNGQIDEFKFFSGDLTQSEITEDYNLNSAKFTNPVPLALSVYYTNDGQQYLAGSINGVVEGNTHLDVYPASGIASNYNWTLNQGIPGNFYSYNSSADLWLTSSDL